MQSLDFTLPIFNNVCPLAYHQGIVLEWEHLLLMTMLRISLMYVPFYPCPLLSSTQRRAGPLLLHAEALSLRPRYLCQDSAYP